MPLVRIDASASASAETRRHIADVVYEAMVEVLNVPTDDRFIITATHDAEGLQIDPGYLGIERGPGALIIQITLNAGRDVSLKRAFYREVVDRLAQRSSVRPEDVMISLVEVAPENWSFGNGLAQYALADDEPEITRT